MFFIRKLYKKIFVIVTEASGDLLGSSIIRSLREDNKNIDFDFIGVGGEKMEQEGLKSIFPVSDLAVMGFFEVMPKIFGIWKRYKIIVNKIMEEKPDLILTIDSPSFNFMIMQKLKSRHKDFFHSVKKVHLIAPSVWAYREKRAQKMAELYDLLLCILPFEPAYFEKYGLKSVFIGHPIFDDADFDRAREYTKQDLMEDYNNIGSDDIVIILTPGSRESEVEKIYPIMMKAIELLRADYNYRQKDYHVFVFSNSITNDLVKFLSRERDFDAIIVLDEVEKEKIMFVADIALAKSGTNTFEFNMFNIPLVVTYTFAWLTNSIVKKVVKVKYANLVNIVADREIIPEFVLGNAKPVAIAREMDKILRNKETADKQLSETRDVIEKMWHVSTLKASRTGAREILKLLLAKN